MKQKSLIEKKSRVAKKKKKRSWMSDVRCLLEADKDVNAEEETGTDSLSSVKRAQCISHSVRTHTQTHTRAKMTHYQVSE